MKLRILLIVLVIFLSLFLGVQNASSYPFGCPPTVTVEFPTDTPFIPTDTPFIPPTETEVLTETPDPTPTVVNEGTPTSFKIEVTPTQPGIEEIPTPSALPDTGVMDDLFKNNGGIFGWVLLGLVCIGLFTSSRLMRKRGL